MDASLADAVSALRAGGVIAYPTEAVWGLGCDPRQRAACERLFAIKHRPPAQGVLLIACDFAHLEPYIDLLAVPLTALDRALATWPGPHTWIFPRSASAPEWVVGAHNGIAVRVTAHPPAAAMCRAFGSAVVSTSANRHGEPALRRAEDVRQVFGDQVDAILNGPLGGLERPTPIRDAISGVSVRS
jgi:L-threonylcarbamoyladenylate synthase